MTDISQARQALRDYARTAHTTPLKEIIGVAWIADPPDIPDGLMISTSRGEVGAKAFMAAQAALTVAEELHVEADTPVNPNLFDWQITGIELVKEAQRRAAERIEAAVLKALA